MVVVTRRPVACHERYVLVGDGCCILTIRLLFCVHSSFVLDTYLTYGEGKGEMEFSALESKGQLGLVFCLIVSLLVWGTVYIARRRERVTLRPLSIERAFSDTANRFFLALRRNVLWVVD